jgi:hypothetical protein
MLLATRLHIGKVVAELQTEGVHQDLWKQAEESSLGIKDIVFAKYIKLRAEQIANEEGHPSKR